MLLVIVAHPDDETFGTGSVIASAAARGARVVVCCATRGEAGEDISGTTDDTEALASVREAELRAAARVLGAAEVVLLEFADSGMVGDMPVNALASVDLEAVVEPLTTLIVAQQPEVVVTLDPVSIDDHRDHTRIGHAATIAFERGAKPSARLYYWTIPRSLMADWMSEIRALGELEAYEDMELGRHDHEVTTEIDATDVTGVRRAAIAEHRTQHGPFVGLSPGLATRIFSRDCLVRALPPWTGGPVETRLFGDTA